MVHVLWAGIKEFQAALSRIQARQLAASRTALRKSLSLIERETKTLLSTSGAGTVGRAANGRFTRAMQIPSAPGEPPHLQTGDLRRSVQQSPIEQIGATRFQGEVGPTIEYGRIQELGGMAGRGAYLPSRPYLEPAFTNVIPEIFAVFKEEWAAALAG